MKIKSVHCDRVKEYKDLVFILSNGTLIYECKHGKEHELMVCGGVIFTKGGMNFAETIEE
jgi:hypothetical protein